MDVVQPLAAIACVMALLGGALLLLKKRGPSSFGITRAFRMARGSGSGPLHLELVERLPLGPQHSLHLVRAGDRLLLIATAPTSCRLLDNAVSAKEKA